jgi:hypothetical protein
VEKMILKPPWEAAISTLTVKSPTVAIDLTGQEGSVDSDTESVPEIGSDICLSHFFRGLGSAAK